MHTCFHQAVIGLPDHGVSTLINLKSGLILMLCTRDSEIPATDKAEANHHHSSCCTLMNFINSYFAR